MFMHWFYYHFKNLRFGKSQHINVFSAAHVFMYVVSSEIMKRRLLNRLLDHPMEVWTSKFDDAFTNLAHGCRHVHGPIRKLKKTTKIKYDKLRNTTQIVTCTNKKTHSTKRTVHTRARTAPAPTTSPQARRPGPGMNMFVIIISIIIMIVMIIMIIMIIMIMVWYGMIWYGMIWYDMIWYVMTLLFVLIVWWLLLLLSLLLLLLV